MLTRDEELVWLAGLKVGDLVAEGHEFVMRVMKVTTTQLICGNSRYNRQTGRLIGAHGFRARWLGPVTPDLLDKVLRSRLTVKLRHDSVEDVPTATLVTVIAMLDRARGGHE